MFEHAGDAIAHARHSRSVTQRKLAELAGVTHRAVTHWESHTRAPTAASLTLVARALDVAFTIDANGIEVERRTSAS